MYKTLKEIWNSLEAKERSYLKAGLFLILILGFFSIVVMPWAFTRDFWSIDDYTSKGGIGDTINGIAGPFIALIASVLTFLAFYIQYKANVQQRAQFILSLQKQKEESQAQEKIWRVERFENKFYELLKLHKANVEEMDIGDNLKGRKCFVHMFYELKYCYKISELWWNAISLQDEFKDKRINLMNFSYRIFFYGIGPQSEKHFLDKLKDVELELFKRVKKPLESMQNQYIARSVASPNDKYYPIKSTYSQLAKEGDIDLFYFPFDGHVNRLGHYYRHLFQTANFIVTQELLNEDEKYGYMKMLRAQLSNFEQLLLYYNALAWFNDEWKEIFTTYRLIKNLPLSLADFDKNPVEHFSAEIDSLGKRGIDLFE